MHQARDEKDEHKDKNKKELLVCKTYGGGAHIQSKSTYQDQVAATGGV